ncbi:MAG: lytic transglycosylase domain-containing protein [Pseudomonadota bacterium]
MGIGSLRRLGFSLCAVLSVATLALLAAPHAEAATFSSGTLQAGAAASTAGETTKSLAPSVLSEDDIDRYEEIFALQARGRWSAADAVIAKVSDPILMGHVRHQRLMHPTAYRSKYSELKRWMAQYADHPQASDIYRLALRRRPKGATPPVRPISRKWRSPESWPLHPDLAADYKRTGKGRLSKIEGRVRYLARKEQAMRALGEIDRHLKARRITTRQYDRMRSWIAASLYYQGYVGKAKSLATSVAKRNGDSAVLAYWIAGLIAFRENDPASARDNFTAMANNPYQEDALRAAGGFWAARANLATSGANSADAVIDTLEIAAAKPFTFYGQLALSQLGREAAFDWTAPRLTEGGYAALVKTHPAVKRAVALVEIDRRADADEELRRVNGRIEDGADYDLLAVATALNLPATQLEVALAGDADYLQAGLYPLPDYQPANGFKTDRAVLYGLMRQESKFKPDATSRVGARGLMQLMPRTASYIAKDRRLASRKGRDRLYDPAFNLQVGQAYVNYLVEDVSDGDLFDVAAAYNGGPGNLRRWKKDLGIDDPLLFIESIPNPESRDFVEKVLTNIWVYRARLGQETPSRDRVAAGDLPLYEALDGMIGER